MFLRTVELLFSLLLPFVVINEGARSIRARYPWIRGELLTVHEGTKLPQRAVLRMTASRAKPIPPPAAVMHQINNGLKEPMARVEKLNEKLRRRKVKAARFQSIFGHSKAIRGSEYVPSGDIEQYTGKLATSRRATFRWAPSGSIVDYFLIPRY